MLDVTDIAHTSHRKKYFFLAFLEDGHFITKVNQGHFALLCKVSAQTDKYWRNESKNCQTENWKKACFRDQLLKNSKNIYNMYFALKFIDY